MNADNKSSTSPRRVISSIGILYKDKLLSQEMQRERISQLENDIALLRLENAEIKKTVFHQDNTIVSHDKTMK